MKHRESRKGHHCEIFFECGRKDDAAKVSTPLKELAYSSPTVPLVRFDFFEYSVNTESSYKDAIAVQPERPPATL